MIFMRDKIVEFIYALGSIIFIYSILLMLTAAFISAPIVFWVSFWCAWSSLLIILITTFIETLFDED